MAAASLMEPHGGGPRRSRQSPITFGRILVVVGVGLAAALIWTLTNQTTVTERPNQVTTTTVILPPPPPPPPPQPEQVEQPPEPTVAPPIDQPLDTPPPPDSASSDPTPGDSALTAREGAGPSNYGLQRGDGRGTVIGGRPGGSGDAFRAYAGVAQRCVQQVVQSDRELTRGRYSMQVSVTFEPDGRIGTVRQTRGDDERRNARVREILVGVQCPPPPAGLPAVKLDLNSRSGG